MTPAYGTTKVKSMPVRARGSRDNMPIYTYRCDQCVEDEDSVVPMSNRDDKRLHSCGVEMQRIVTVPRLVLMKQTGKGMALDALNSKDTFHMKPDMKALAVAGLKEPEKTLF